MLIFARSLLTIADFNITCGTADLQTLELGVSELQFRNLEFLSSQPQDGKVAF